MGTYGSGSRAEVVARQDARRKRLDADPPVCGHCNQIIEPPRRYLRNVTYCSQRHRDAALRERAKLKDRLKIERALAPIEEPIYDPTSAKKGQVYDEVAAELDDTEWSAWIRRLITDEQVGRRIGRPAQSVGRARRYAANEAQTQRIAEGFEVADQFMAMLGPSDKEMRALLAEDPEQFDAMLDELVDAFVRWRDHFFDAWEDTKYITKPAHRLWMKETLRAIYTGGRLMILSPPRHGKTELQIHFCVWLICRNPNIRILYIGPNEDIAMNCVGQVKNLLASHEALQNAYLAPGQSWEPSERQGRLWRDKMFRVGNRTMERKQPTMWAAGVGGKITTLDADYIVVDDPADPDDSQQQAGRIRISKWMRMKLLTRKMKHTGLCMDSSRCHFDDLYSEFIDSPQWSVIVDKAHDDGICGLGLYDDHTHLASPDACVLFPEMNPIDHLREMANDVGAELFDMMFQNMPRPDGTAIFDPDIIRAYCLDRSRGLGLQGITSPGYTLIAGLDPAARNTQASFCWAFDFANDVDWMVDLETEEAGGIEGAIRIIRKWHEWYGVLIWVLEDVGFQILYHSDPRIKALKDEIPGLQILPCTTGMNKHDPYFGVSGMATRYHEGGVNLPYGDPEAVRKTDRLIRQLTLFTGETGHKSRHKSDILMASWFPFPDVVRRLRGHVRQIKAVITHNQSYAGYQPSTYAEAPWEQTQYPG